MTRREEMSRAIGRPLLTLGGLLLLLTLTTVYALAPQWPAKAGVSILIAGLKALVVLVIFMRLDKASALIRLTAIAGFAWLAIMLVLAWADYASRGLTS